MTRIAQQHGYILLPVVMLITLVAAVAFMINNESVLDSGITGSKAEAKQVEYVAQAGLQHAIWANNNSGCAGDMAMTTVPFGQAGTNNYTATVTTPGGSTTAYTNLAADQDAWFRSDDVTRNNGTTADMHLRMESGNLEYALYRFDLSSLPAGSQINSASMWLYVTPAGPGGGAHPEGPLTVHRVTSDWTETGATWDTMSSHFDSAVIATIPAQPQDAVWVQVNLTAQLQAWVNGSEANYGIMLIPTGEGTHAKYVSREGTASEQPRLDVVVGNGPASPMAISVTGTLTGKPSPANDITRSLTRTPVAAYQPPAYSFLQLHAGSGKDAMLNSFYSSRDYGNHELQVSIGFGSTLEYSLLQFDLSTIPQGARILSARLALYHYVNTGTPVDPGVDVHRLTRSWVEGTHGGTGTADGATWGTSDGVSNWSSAGGDYDTLAVASSAISSATGDWESWEIGNLVQGWINGSYPNNGLILKGTGALDVSFASKEDADSTLHPRLNITYACECGSTCLAPQGSGNILMVVSDEFWMTPDEQKKKDSFEDWGYTVNLISQWDVSWNFNALAVNNDVVYVSEGVNHTTWGMAPELVATSLGVVNEEGLLNDALGISNNAGATVGSALNVTDSSHYITTPFPAGPLEIYHADMEQLAIFNGQAPGLQTLADVSGSGSLVVLDKGAALGGDESGENAAGRRVMLPLGTEANFNWDYLNSNGLLLVQRALQWATGNTGSAPAQNLLLVIAGSTPTAQEQLRIDLIQSWGYGVTVIDDNDSQANFDTAVAANDVAYVSSTVSDAALGTKLKNTALGVVNEELTLHDEFGFSSGSGSNAFDKIMLVDNTHEITTGFSTGWLTVVTSPQTLQALDNTLAPGLQTLATTWISGANYKDGLALLDTGADLHDGGTAAGRRAQLPWGGSGFNFSALNDNGKTIMQRAIEWAEGGSGSSILIGHWMLDDASGTVATDSSGQGNHGTLSNGPAWIAGILNDALDFDGSDDLVLVADDPSLDITDNITLMAWIRPNKTATQYVIRKALFDSTDGYELSLSATGKVFFRLNQASNANSYRIDSTTSYPVDGTTWMHIAATYDGAVMRLYLDGVEEASLNAAINISANDTDLSIGAQVDGSRGIDGLIDDVWLYGSALSATDIAANADSKPLTPLAHWKLDETSGTTAVDSVGGHDGTLNNGPVWSTGQIDGALDFDGSNDAIRVTHADTLSLTETMTFTAWVNASSFGSTYQTIIAKDGGGGGSNYYFGTWQQELVFGFFSGGFFREVFTSGLNLQPGTWYHLAASFNNSMNLVLLYLDGVPVQKGELTFSPTAVTADLSIGRSPDGEYWRGLLDDVRIYDSVLPASEIADLYTAAGGGGGGGGSGSGSCDGTFRDEFNTVSFSNNDGTLTWATDWLEINESDGPNAGDEKIKSGRLEVNDNDGGGEGAQREADLTGAGSAMLTFDYNRKNLDDTDDYVTIDISANGDAGPWIELGRFEGPGTDAGYLPVSYNIGAYISNNTRIRFLTSPGLGDKDDLKFDNVEILCAP
jgi:Tfp pilus assembly protein PilX